MNTPPGSEAGSSQTLPKFLERVRKSFSHDLRTPLSTIVNYASVLEAMHGAESEEVRDLGRRIRGNALRTARMIQTLANAIALAGRPLRATPTDLAALARSLLVDAGGRGEVQLVPPGAAVSSVDAEVLGYVWRAYVAVEVDAGTGPLHAVELEVGAAGADVVVEMRCGARDQAPAPSPALTELSNYLRHNGGASRLESSMGLTLAKELLESHGGEFGIWGRPASASGLRLRLPAASAMARFV